MVRLELMAFNRMGVGVTFFCWHFHMVWRELGEWIKTAKGLVCVIPARWSSFSPRTSTLEVHPWSVPYGLVVGRRFGRGNTLGGTSKDEPGNRGHNVATVIGWIRAMPLAFLGLFFYSF